MASAMGLLPGGILKKVLMVAVAASPPSTASSGRASGLSLSDVPGPSREGHTRPSAKSDAEAFFAEMDWHELVGKRVRDTQVILNDPGCIFRTLLYTFLIGASELVSAWLMSATSSNVIAFQEPPVFDFLDPRRSIVQAVTQFFSAFLLAEPPMVVFLCTVFGVPAVRS